MDTQTADALSGVMDALAELERGQAYMKAKLTSLTKELAIIKVKYSNLRTPTIFQLKDYVEELRSVETKISGIQGDINQITADLVEFTNKLK